jgi:hypothetical protein
MTITMANEEVIIGVKALCALLSAIVGYRVQPWHVLRIRDQYTERVTPAIMLPGQLCGFTAAHVDSIVAILREEDRCR